jgi:hypothetical protein
LTTLVPPTYNDQRLTPERDTLNQRPTPERDTLKREKATLERDTLECDTFVRPASSGCYGFEVYGQAAALVKNGILGPWRRKERIVGIAGPAAIIAISIVVGG